MIYFWVWTLHIVTLNKDFEPLKLERIGSSHPWQKTLHAATIKVFIDFLFQGLGFSLLKTRKCCSVSIKRRISLLSMKRLLRATAVSDLSLFQICFHSSSMNNASMHAQKPAEILLLFSLGPRPHLRFASVFKGEWLRHEVSCSLGSPQRGLGRLPGLADPCIVMRSDEVKKGGTRKWERTAWSVFGPAPEIQILYVQLSCLQVYVRAFLWC